METEMIIQNMALHNWFNLDHNFDAGTLLSSTK